ncbi:class I SAM-dependent methyltransferase [Balneolaceae bacterium YR4-1]|uniref:Class I SAM-dependent methyltransferase n=1 Tax=Halalkalibaculum roseum TaxID=2709311 RepID=A0A6M1SUS6_9BACT|nr:class I SAM-dependent methyltransferase [Halalkalibaculum roseum]NGP76690.1 class I SAM-dependent methyltransferase [Halalkalibaculum roseum]
MLKNILYKGIKKLYHLSITGLNKGPHVTRFYMYKYLVKFSESRPADQKVLSISHSENLARIIGFKDEQITDASYPEINILDLPFNDAEFDAVVSDQVLEHVEGNPQLAIDEMFRVLKPNGISVQATCLINPVHGAPKDFWRFTPEGLKHLTKHHGEVLDVGGWGNPYVWLFIFLGLRFEPIPNSQWHPAHWLATKNVKSWPISTWVINKKRITD